MAANLSPLHQFCKQSFAVGLFVWAVMASPVVGAATMQDSVIKAIEAKQWGTARQLIDDSNDTTLKSIYIWRKMLDRKEKISFSKRMSFARRYPNWPAKRSFAEGVERSISKQDDQDAILSWFDDNAPITAEGFMIYAEALLQANQRTKFKELLNEWWANTPMPRSDQKYIYTRFKSQITPQSHKKRIDKLLFNKQYTNARAIARVLGAGYPQLVEARIGLMESKNGVDGLIKRVPQSLQQDSGLLYERLKWRRKRNLNKRAVEILDNAPDHSAMANPDKWWQERHILIRRYLEQGNYQQAYRLAAGHKQISGFPYAQAEWLKGWLALRFVSKPQVAYDSFVALSQNVTMPVSLARAYYWAGRAALVLDKQPEATQYFAKAARYPTIYYGQRAAKYVAAPPLDDIMGAPHLLPSEKKQYANDTLMRAAHLYASAGYAKIAQDFVWVFAKKYNSPQTQSYAIEQAQKMKLYNAVVKLSKQASQKGWFVSDKSYPVVKNLLVKAHDKVDPALIHALMRQESQFDPYARSGVGALGLMQLMPATAKGTARKYRIRHYKSWLTKKPTHNVQLGSYYMNDLLNRYDGDVILAIGAYNAGPGRVRQWLRDFPDPRAGEISYEDWIELIPVYETRNYIQRVSEGMSVYQKLLGMPVTQLAGSR